MEDATTTTKEMLRISDIISMMDFAFPSTTFVDYDILQKGKLTLRIENIRPETKNKMVWPRLTRTEKSHAQYSKKEGTKGSSVLRIPFKFPVKMWEKVLPVLLLPISHPDSSLGLRYSEGASMKVSLKSFDVALFLKGLAENQLNSRDYYNWVEKLDQDGFYGDTQSNSRPHNL